MLTLYLVLDAIDELPQFLNLVVLNGPYRIVGNVISILAILLEMFLIMPAQTGAVYLEMDQRMEGRVGSVYQLFRYALPMGLRRFYSTFFVVVAVGIISILVLYFVLVALGLAVFIPVGVSLMRDGFFANAIPSGMGEGIVFLGIVVLFFFLSLDAFLTPVFPVVAHEGRRAFGAISRSYKLAVKRFGRLLLCGLFMFVVGFLVVWLPDLILRQNMSEPSFLPSLIAWLTSALVTPFWIALLTVLYVDIAAHVDAMAATAQEKPLEALTNYDQPAQSTGEPQDNRQALPDSWADAQPQEKPETDK